MLGPPWNLSFPPASAGGLLTLIPDGESFAIRFDGKDTEWIGYRAGSNFLLNGQTNPAYGKPDVSTNSDKRMDGQQRSFHPDLATV